MVESQPPASIGVDEESLEAIKSFPVEIQAAVAKVLATVKACNSSEHFEPCESIPDDAPVKVKNEISNGRGRAFRIGIEMPDQSILVMSWYEPHDRRFIVFWRISWPADVIIDEH